MADKKTKSVAIVFAGGLSEAAKKVIQEAIASVEGGEYQIVEAVVPESDIVELKGNLSTIEKELKTKTENYEKLSEEFTKVSAALGEAQDAADKGYVIVKSGKKTYRVTGKKFCYKGIEFTTDDLKKDQKLVDELVKIKVGFLTEVKEEN